MDENKNEAPKVEDTKDFEERAKNLMAEVNPLLEKYQIAITAHLDPKPEALGAKIVLVDNKKPEEKKSLVDTLEAK